MMMVTKKTTTHLRRWWPFFSPLQAHWANSPSYSKKKQKKLSVRGAPHYIEFVLAHATHPQLFAQSSQTHSFAQTKSLYTPFSLSLSLSLCAQCFLCIWLCSVCASAISLVVRYHGQLANRLWVQLPPLSPTHPLTHSPNQLPTILTHINSVHWCQQVN